MRSDLHHAAGIRKKTTIYKLCKPGLLTRYAFKHRYSRTALLSDAGKIVDPVCNDKIIINFFLNQNFFDITILRKLLTDVHSDEKIVMFLLSASLLFVLISAYVEK